MLRQGPRFPHPREVLNHRIGALTLVRGNHRHPPDSYPLGDIRPRDRERRRALLDAQTHLGERFLEAIPGTRVGFAPRRAPKDHFAIFAPSLLTDDDAQHLPNAVVALPGRDHHSSASEASRELCHGSLDVRDKLQHVAGENKIERRRLERQPRHVRTQQPAFRADPIARRQQHVERQINAGDCAIAGRRDKLHQISAVSASDIEHVARIRDLGRERLEHGLATLPVVGAVAVGRGQPSEVRGYISRYARSESFVGIHLARMTENPACGKVRRLLSSLASLGFPPWRGLSVAVDRTDLSMLPDFDCRAAEPPRAPDPEARDSSFAEQAVYRRRMNAQVRRQLRDCKNFFRGCHHITPPPLRETFMAPPYRAVSLIAAKKPTIQPLIAPELSQYAVFPPARL